MKSLTYNEFEDRMIAINRARHIFIKSGLTKNIDIAFQLYQEIFAETKRRSRISSDSKARKKCPKCGRPMKIGEVNNSPSTQVGGTWKTQWICWKCDEFIFDNRTMQEIFAK